MGVTEMLPLLFVMLAQDPAIVGTWKLTDEKVKTSGPREVVIRSDSSASWGKEHSRWRILPGSQIKIAVGGEWETYKFKVKGNKLTISGGDLPDPITLTKVGPATPRPDGVPVPPDPDTAPPI
jgi:hypothetical protein